jgi:hypothetical protein
MVEQSTSSASIKLISAGVHECEEAIDHDRAGNTRVERILRIEFVQRYVSLLPANDCSFLYLHRQGTHKNSRAADPLRK